MNGKKRGFWHRGERGRRKRKIPGEERLQVAGVATLLRSGHTLTDISLIIPDGLLYSKMSLFLLLFLFENIENVDPFLLVGKFLFAQSALHTWRSKRVDCKRK